MAVYIFLIFSALVIVVVLCITALRKGHAATYHGANASSGVMTASSAATGGDRSPNPSASDSDGRTGA